MYVKELAAMVIHPPPPKLISDITVMLTYHVALGHSFFIVWFSRIFIQDSEIQTVGKKLK